MQQEKTYKKVGLFVVIGVICLLGIIFNYAGRKFMTDDENMVVMYFDESIQGLSVGSSVILQGVEIGKVSKIKLIADLHEGTFKTLVYVLFDKKKMASPKGEKFGNRHILDNLIEKGLRGQLESASLLTGQLLIQLVMVPDQKAVLQGSGKYREIPTILSPYAKFSKDLEEIPLRESMVRLGDILVDLDEKLPVIMDNMAQITAKFDKMLDKRSGELSKTLDNANTTMEEISKASRSLKNLTDYLERHPEALIRGKEK